MSKNTAVSSERDRYGMPIANLAPRKLLAHELDGGCEGVRLRNVARRSEKANQCAAPIQPSDRISVMPEAASCLIWPQRDSRRQVLVPGRLPAQRKRTPRPSHNACAPMCSPQLAPPSSFSQILAQIERRTAAESGMCFLRYDTSYEATRMHRDELRFTHDFNDAGCTSDDDEGEHDCVRGRNGRTRQPVLTVPQYG
ncbi:hypothetical protein EIP86_003036 [Pleurotus ostreatoroseus]|nr:hypothetical protein EIP86_003036 [Pleurotus ostreatoroseus]